MKSTQTLRDQIKSKLSEFDVEALQPFLDDLNALLAKRNGVLAILAYGSCLSQKTKSSTSTPDFYVVVDQYSQFHQKKKEQWINKVVPPNIYHFHSSSKTAKYNVISLDRLKKETDTRAKDLYHIGRFSKRMALVHQEKEVSQDIAMISLNAKTFALRAALDLLPKSFSLEEACKKMLEISYLGDVRVEAFDKVEKIYKAEHIYYLHIVSQLLDTISWIQKDPSGKYTQDRIFLWSHRWKSMYFIYKSKVRSQLRWPKNMFTVEHWIDYVLAKIKRTHGLTFELTEKEKKYWYIYGWKYLFELRKKKIF